MKNAPSPKNPLAAQIIQAALNGYCAHPDDGEPLELDVYDPIKDKVLPNCGDGLAVFLVSEIKDVVNGCDGKEPSAEFVRIMASESMDAIDFAISELLKARAGLEFLCNTGVVPPLESLFKFDPSRN